MAKLRIKIVKQRKLTHTVIQNSSPGVQPKSDVYSEPWDNIRDVLTVTFLRQRRSCRLRDAGGLRVDDKEEAQCGSRDEGSGVE